MYVIGREVSGLVPGAVVVYDIAAKNAECGRRNVQVSVGVTVMVW